MRFIFLFTIMTALASCSKVNSDVVYERVFEISAKSEIGGVYPPGSPDDKIPVMRVLDQKDKSSFTLTLNQIEGFEFEEGTSYIIKVEITELASPPMDGSSKRYRLIEIINKN